MSVSLASRNAATRVFAPPPWRVVTSIARVEVRRLVRHPVFLFGAMLSAVVLVSITWSRAPVLHRDDVFTGVALMPLAAVTLLLANVASSRGRRHGTEELYDTGPATPALLTAGQLVGVVGGATLVAFALVIADVAYLKAIGGVWWPSTFELATGPAIVAFSGAFGLALARWVPSLVVAPLAVVGLGALQVWLTSTGGYLGSGQWFGFWVPFESDLVAREVVIRPAGWHLLYLAGFVGLFASLAVLRLAAGRRVVVASVAAVAVIGSSGGVLAQRPSEARLAKELAKVAPPERTQVCENHGPVRYCAYPAYAPWIERWARAGTGTIRQVPPGTSAIEVRQRLRFIYSSEDVESLFDPSILRGPAFGSQNPDAVPIGFAWGRGSTEGTAELAVALGVASAAVGLPPAPRQYSFTYTQHDVDALLRGYRKAGVEPPAPLPFTAGDRVEQTICDTRGQARAAVALWLAAQATPGASQAFRQLVRELPYGIQIHRGMTLAGVTGASGWTSQGGGQYNLFENPFAFAQGVLFERAEATYAAQLLARPAGEVGETIRRHWSTLTDPKTPTDELRRLLGLKRLPTSEEQIRAAGFDPIDARVFELDQAFYSVPCP